MRKVTIYYRNMRRVFVVPEELGDGYVSDEENLRAIICGEFGIAADATLALTARMESGEGSKQEEEAEDTPLIPWSLTALWNATETEDEDEGMYGFSLKVYYVDDATGAWSNTGASASNVGHEDGATNEYYFSAYSNVAMHRHMLEDSARTLAYRAAIEGEALSLITKDKSKVLDVGCGSGILSLFAVGAGAAHVYGVDASAMAPALELTALWNKVEDRLTVLSGRMEDVVLPEKVDVIVSEWMGNFLWSEGMAESVLVARDTWMSPGGVMVPATASLYLAPISTPKYYDSQVDWWKSVYGWDLRVLSPFAAGSVLSQPNQNDVELTQENLVSDEPLLLGAWDMHTVREDELNGLKSRFEFTVKPGPGQSEGDDDGMVDVHGFAAWFDVGFCDSPEAAASAVDAVSSGGKPSDIGQQVLSTAPDAPSTHWKQTVMYLHEPIRAPVGSKLRGTFRARIVAETRREYDLDIAVMDEGKGRMLYKSFRV